MEEKRPANSTRKLALITEQRAALEKVVKISLAITHLQNGLESMLTIGREASQLPPEHIKTFEVISESIKHLPTGELKSAVSHLDSYITTALHGVMELVSQGENLLSGNNVDTDEISNLHKDIHIRLNTFRRKSQTAVVVRLLLRRRGFNTVPFVLPIPESTIVSKIIELEEKEKRCRQRIGEEIDLMESYIDNLLQTEELPAFAREEMQKVKVSLQNNRTHLLEGKPIDELPIVFEIVEMGDESIVYDLGIESHNEESRNKNTKETSATTQPEQSRKRRGLFSRLKIWITSPVNVHWKDIDKYE